MQRSMSYIRRSRLKPITYSMCCQRADQRVPVADLGVAGDRADARVGERLDQLADGGRLEDGVAVHHHDQVVTGVRAGRC